ncbi:MAG: HEAT repeat domain-containing protein [Myxococcales bacterium]|nr:HEAT repeat domain-containing protein [Myxococcales bacterium]
MRCLVNAGLLICIATVTPSVALAAPATFSWQATADAQAAHLASPVPETRYRAIAALATQSAATAGPLLLTVLAAEPLDVRSAQEAIAALAMVGYAPAVSTLASLLASPEPLLRGAAVRALASMHAVEHLKDVIRSLGDPEPTVRAIAAEALGVLAVPTQHRVDVVSPLVGRLQDKAVAVRLATIGALAKLQDPRARLAIAAAMSDANVDVRRAALTAAIEVAERSLAQSMVPLLRDPSAEVRALAARALGVLGDQDAVAPLLGVLAGAATAERGEILVALARLARQGHQPGSIAHALALATARGEPGAAMAVATMGAAFATTACAILDGTVRGDRALALEALARAPAEKSRDCVVRELGRNRSPVRPLFTALARIATPAAIADLAAYIADPDPDIARIALIMVAPHAGLDPRIIDLLLPMVDQPSIELASAALEGLGKTGDAAAIGPLLAVLAPNQTPARPLAVQRAAIDALAALRQPDALPALIELLTRGDAVTAMRAARAIATIGDPRAARDLTPLIEQNHSRRGLALQTLVLLAGAPGAKALPFSPAQWRSWASSPEPVLAHAAIAGLARLPTSAAQQSLLTIARTGAHEFAAQAACALLVQAIPTEVRSWIELLGHPSDAIGACAAEGIARLVWDAPMSEQLALALEALGKALDTRWATAINSSAALACARLAGHTLSDMVARRLASASQLGSPLVAYHARIASGATRLPTSKAVVPASTEIFSRVHHPDDDPRGMAGAGFVATRLCRDQRLGWAGYTDGQGWLPRASLIESDLREQFGEAQLASQLPVAGQLQPAP